MIDEIYLKYRLMAADVFGLFWSKRAITLIVNILSGSFAIWALGRFTPNQAWAIGITYIPVAKGFLMPLFKVAHQPSSRRNIVSPPY
ncbi:hypothetical protein AK966_11395 [Vibrio sp. PID23_8]|nr:hypothetical protein AK966_11395 [Vibrio sp. PID23_8]